LGRQGFLKLPGRIFHKAGSGRKMRGITGSVFCAGKKKKNYGGPL
jgi:hypothetical protein